MEGLAWGRRKIFHPGRLERRKRSAEAVKDVVGTGELRQLSFYDLKFLIKIRRDGVLAGRGTLGLDGRDLKRALEIRIVPEERGTDGLQSMSSSVLNPQRSEPS